MNSQVLLVVIALVVWIVMALCGLIPICIVAKKASQGGNFTRGTERIISFCNCMASGVFIAMCFLGLLPYAQEKTRQLFVELQITTDFPLAEFICIIGFFLMMTIEQLVLRCHEKKTAAKAMWDDQSPSVVEASIGNCSKSNYYKTVPDESSTEELLAKNSLEAISPNSPSILKEPESPRVYQNVPMVTFQQDTEEQDGAKKESSSSHHHSHYQHIEKLMSNEPGGMLRLIVLYMAISIHSLFEGMALGLQTEHLRIFHLFFAILFHEALVAFSVGITMTRQRLEFSKAVKSMLLFSTAVPLGILLGIAVQQAPGTAGSIFSAIFQSLAAGIFIHVTFLELVPAEMANSRDRLAKVAFTFIGFISLALVTVTMGSHH